MAVIASESVDALYTAANKPSMRRPGRLELALPNGISALVYTGPLEEHGKVLVVEVVTECYVNAYFAKPPKKGKQWFFDNWQPKPLTAPMSYGFLPEPAKARVLLARLLESIENSNPPQLPPGFPAKKADTAPARRKAARTNPLKILSPYKYQHGMIGRQQHKLLPFQETPEVHEALDAIADACERGLLQQETWVSQCFVSAEIFDGFIETLSEYDECFRIHDRWYQALMRLGDVFDEEGFISTREIAGRLVERVVETGQIES